MDTFAHRLRNLGAGRVKRVVDVQENDIAVIYAGFWANVKQRRRYN